MLATFTACQKDEGLVSDGATSQTITVTIPQGMQTRATAADFGNGRCVYETASYRWAVKTNVAYLAATVANLGVEYSFGDRYSVDLPVIYSPYTVARDYRLCFLAVQPEFRYWLKKPMEGHFFGVHLPVSYTQLDVYKRQVIRCAESRPLRPRKRFHGRPGPIWSPRCRLSPR